MQFQADVLGVPVIVPEVAETTALGAAYLPGSRPSCGRSAGARCGEAAAYERPDPSRRADRAVATRPRAIRPVARRQVSRRNRACGAGRNQHPRVSDGVLSLRPEMPKVNPKDMKPQVYKDRAPPRCSRSTTEALGEASAGSTTSPGDPHDPDDRHLQDPGDRRREHPGDGPVILAPNHFSQGPLLRRCVPAAEGPVHGEVPAVHEPHQVHLQARRCLPRAPRSSRRGGLHHLQHDSRARRHRAPVRRGRPLADRRPRRAEARIGKIALETGAPVVPVAIHGSPTSRGWRRLRFPKVTIQYGEPVTFP